MSESRARFFSNLAANVDSDGVLAPGVAGGVVSYDSAGLLPRTGMSAGDQAFTLNNGRLYISTGSGWYNIALINRTPTITSIVDENDDTGPFTLSDQGATTTITITATDSDGDLLTYSAQGDTDFNNLASVSQDSSVFTITPFSEDSASATSGVLTFTASDGINQTSSNKTFNLVFAPAISWTNLIDSSGPTTVNITSLANDSFKSWNSTTSNYYSAIANGYCFGTVWKTEGSAVNLDGFRFGTNSTSSDGFGYWIYRTSQTNGIGSLLSGTLVASGSPTVSMNGGDYTYSFGVSYEIPAYNFFIIIMTSMATHTWTPAPGYNLQYTLNGTLFLRQMASSYHKTANTGYTNNLEAPSQFGGSASYSYVTGPSSYHPRLYPIISEV